MRMVALQEGTHAAQHSTAQHSTAQALRLIGLAGAMGLLFTPESPGQTFPPRSQYIFDLYVDPNFGDNDRAWASNPGIAGNPAPLSLHPSATANGIGGLLQHAPFAFRTLTGPHGAGAYIDQLSSQYSASGTPPWNMGNQKYVTWVVIHCLPGIYAPLLPGDPLNTPNPIDPRNGLRFNAETWPFTLRNGVSLQGTSALDTIFDARGKHTAIVVVEPLNFTTPTHRGSFIDALTIRGARSDGQVMSRANGSGAGILIGDSVFGLVGCQITISNCFIIDNDVGLAVDSGGDYPSNPHQPVIVNNTFARNTIGIWNGNRQGPSLNKGFAQLILLNNVLDSWRPGPFPGGPFAGVCAEDLLVVSLFSSLVPLWTLNPGGTPAGLSFNAWEDARPPGLVVNWLSPGSRTATVMPKPRVDLTNYTGTLPNTPRGTIFVNDVLLNAAVGGTGVDYSANDFRLAPMASTSNVNFHVNPLVNNGLRCIEALTSPNHHIILIAFGNGLSVTFDPALGRVPGLPTPLRPSPAEDLATFHAWDWDCDGIGNPRGVARSGFPTPAVPDNPTSSPILMTMDLGADEMDELIIAGYIDSTRIFSRAIPGAAAVLDHTRLFFLNVHTAGNSYPRPVANRIRGRLFGWWPHIQQTPSPDNYTSGVPGSGRNGLVPVKGPFMRNLECDFSPHLYPDPHPQWAEQWELAFPGTTDVYASMPWYTSTAAFPYDNAYLYYNPIPGYPAHGNNFTSARFQGVQFTQVIAGLVNPPGSALTGTANEYLHPHFTASTLGPWLPCSATPSATYSVGPNGLGSTAMGCPDVVPIGSIDEQWKGIRYNAQVRLEPESSLAFNLQTFLTVNGVVALPPTGDTDPQSTTNAEHQPSVDTAVRRLNQGR